MGVYNDLACDAGYAYGTPENEQVAQMIEADERRRLWEQTKFDDFWPTVYKEYIADWIEEHFTTA